MLSEAKHPATSVGRAISDEAFGGRSSWFLRFAQNDITRSTGISAFMSHARSFQRPPSPLPFSKGERRTFARVVHLACSFARVINFDLNSCNDRSRPTL